MERKKKRCKGTGKAATFTSCGQASYIHRYGLCFNCFKDWLFGTDEGQSVLESTRIKARRQAEKETKSEVKKKKEESRTKSWYEKKLQNEINEIVRLIDTDKGCISCAHGWEKPATRQFQRPVKSKKKLYQEEILQEQKLTISSKFINQSRKRYYENNRKR